MTVGTSFLYSECSNALLEKGIYHVSDYTHVLESNPNLSCARDCTDHNFGYRSNHWFHGNRDRSHDRTAKPTGATLALESFHLPLPNLE